MAQREDMKKRLGRLDPQVQDILDQVDRRYAELGGKGGIVVTLTEDMTPEEEELALFAGFLKEGYPEDIAARKAREWLDLLDQFAKDNERRR